MQDINKYINCVLVLSTKSWCLLWEVKCKFRATIITFEPSQPFTTTQPLGRFCMHVDDVIYHDNKFGYNLQSYSKCDLKHEQYATSNIFNENQWCIIGMMMLSSLHYVKVWFSSEVKFGLKRKQSADIVSLQCNYSTTASNDPTTSTMWLKRQIMMMVHYLSESLSSVGTRSMYQQWMEEYCITSLHLQICQLFIRVVILDSMIVLVHTSL